MRIVVALCVLLAVSPAQALTEYVTGPHLKVQWANYITVQHHMINRTHKTDRLSLRGDRR